MGLTMSLSYMFNVGHDVDGFAGPVPDPELLVRWVQIGAFSRRFIMNSWKEGGETNTPCLHPEATPIIRDWIRLRYRMLPYLYTLYRRAAHLGEPMLRPLCYKFDDDPRNYADSDVFTLGPWLLVASVVESGQRERDVYLLAGPPKWIDCWTGRHLAAGRTHVAPDPLERSPLFMPAGAMIPATDTADMGRFHDEPSRALRIFPGRGRAASAFTLYEEDGLTRGHRDGDHAEVELTLEWTERRLQVWASRRGRIALPYAPVRVVPPPGERRHLEVEAEGFTLNTAYGAGGAAPQDGRRGRHHAGNNVPSLRRDRDFGHCSAGARPAVGCARSRDRRSG
jgi:alpha-glucosidase